MYYSERRMDNFRLSRLQCYSSCVIMLNIRVHFLFVANKPNLTHDRYVCSTVHSAHNAMVQSCRSCTFLFFYFYEDKKNI